MRLARRFSRSVARALPKPVAGSIRQLVLVWGTATARWRMTPDFIIVGAQRAGTTTLFRMLSEHHQVTRPTLNKGVAYFDLNYHRSWSWYLGHFPLRRPALMPWRKRLVTFESSGYYMLHPLAPARIAADLPDVKIVVMLRDPVDRAHSAHRHEERRGFETEDFETALRLEPHRIEGEADRIVRNPTYASYELQHHAYLERGQYADHIERIAGSIGYDRIYIIDADRFFEDPAREFSALCQWLDLEDPHEVDARAWNAAPRAPLEPEMRTRLSAHFEPYDRRLEAILGRPPSWRSVEMSIDQQVNDAT